MWCMVLIRGNTVYDFLKNHLQRRVFHYVTPVIWKIIYKEIKQRKCSRKKIDRARECIFKAFGGTNFESLTAWQQPWWHHHGFDDFTCLSNSWDMSLTEWAHCLLATIYLLLQTHSFWVYWQKLYHCV